MSFALNRTLKTELYRKAVHLSSLWMPALIITLPRNINIVLFFALLTLNILAERAAYCKSSGFGCLFRRMFIKTLRNREISRTNFVPSGSVYILAAALITCTCYTGKAAATAMAVMLIADTCAALAGRFLGKIKFYNGKSLEGVSAFILSALLTIVYFFPHISPAAAVATACLACAAEFFEKEIKIDDNLGIPLIAGFILNLIA